MENNELAIGSLQRRRLIVGISGATGAIYWIRLLQVLKSAP